MNKNTETVFWFSTAFAISLMSIVFALNEALDGRVSRAVFTLSTGAVTAITATTYGRKAQDETH